MVKADPEPKVRLHELGESSVNFVVRPWVTTDEDWRQFSAAGVDAPDDE